MNYHIFSYIVYLCTTIGITAWVASILLRNIKVFLLDIFSKKKDIAQSVTHLLIISFYLISLGYIFFSLQITGEIDSTQILLEKLSFKLGFVVLFLGVECFLFMCVIFVLRTILSLVNIYNRKQITLQKKY